MVGTDSREHVNCNNKVCDQIPSILNPVVVCLLIVVFSQDVEISKTSNIQSKKLTHYPV